MIPYRIMDQSKPFPDSLTKDIEAFPLPFGRSIRSYFLRDPENQIQTDWHQSFHNARMGCKTLFIIYGNACDYPVLFIEIDPSFDKDLCPSDLIKYIEFEVGGTRVDRIHQHQIEALLALYNLHWDYKDHCLILPLPFDLFFGQNLYYGYGSYHEARFTIEFLAPSHIPNVINGAKLRLYSLWMSEAHKRRFNHVRRPEARALFYQTQFCGEETINSSGPFKTHIFFNHQISCLYWYFTNEQGQIVIDPVFDQVRLWLDGQRYNDRDFDSVSLATKGYELCGLKGLYWLAMTNRHPLVYDPTAIQFSKVGESLLEFDNISIAGLKLHLYGGNHNIFVYEPDGLTKVLYSA